MDPGFAGREGTKVEWKRRKLEPETHNPLPPQPPLTLIFIFIFSTSIFIFQHVGSWKGDQFLTAQDYRSYNAGDQGGYEFIHLVSAKTVSLWKRETHSSFSKWIPKRLQNLQIFSVKGEYWNLLPLMEVKKQLATAAPRTQGIFKLKPIHDSVVSHIPWIYWKFCSIFRKNSYAPFVTCLPRSTLQRRRPTVPFLWTSQTIFATVETNVTKPSPLQWRIQDFLDGRGGATPEGC